MQPTTQDLAQGKNHADGQLNALQTDMIMLQKADVWMSQFKTRLNIGIIALVVLWGGVSYFKSMNMQQDAHKASEPERILADGSMDHAVMIESDANKLLREASLEAEEEIKTEEAAVNLPVKAVKTAPKPMVKKAEAPKALKNKMPASKSGGRNQKKLKKSLASKPGR